MFTMLMAISAIESQHAQQGHMQPNIDLSIIYSKKLANLYRIINSKKEN